MICGVEINDVEMEYNGQDKIERGIKEWDEGSMVDEMWGEKDIRRGKEMWGGDEMWMGMRYGRNEIWKWMRYGRKWDKI